MLWFFLKYGIIYGMNIVISSIKIVLIKKNIKNINMRVLPPDGAVKISAPLNVSDIAIEEFVLTRLDWIKKNQEKMQEKYRIPNYQFVNDEVHYFNGLRYTLHIIYTIGRERVLLIDYDINMFIHKESSKEDKERILNAYYKKYLICEVKKLVENWQEVLGVQVEKIGIRKMKTRWGTCNTTSHKIWINLELAKKPYYCLEYIVIHEMVHLLEASHNPIFYSYMDKFLPSWKMIKKDLNKYDY